MALYDYPHTGNYDQDLGFLIKQYKDLIDGYKGLIDIYAKFLEEIEKNIHIARNYFEIAAQNNIETVL